MAIKKEPIRMLGLTFRPYNILIIIIIIIIIILTEVNNDYIEYIM